MRVQLVKTFGFEAAHHLPSFPDGHKCRRMHGHSFRVSLHVAGAVDERLGWVMDFADVKRAFAPLFDQLDHNCLNEVPGLDNPTSENLAIWIWQHLVDDLPGLARIEVHETCTSGCLYAGP